MSKITKELRALDKAQLNEKLVELHKQLSEQKIARAAGELANPHAIQKTRRQIAITKTLLSQGAEAVAAVKKEEA